MRKKVDNRVRTLVENGVQSKTRSFFVIVGDRGRDQVVNLHYMVTKMTAKKPQVLWCYKKELGFSSHRKKRMKQVKRQMQRGQHDPNIDDPFELFISSTNIRYCYYKDTEQVLGKTYGMCILQDFEALTPNLLCRTLETVEGGGLIVLLVRSMDSLQQLYKLTMDAHTNLRTETHVDVEPRFNERLILSLKECEACLVVDDELNILPISSHAKNLKPVERESHEEGDEPPQTMSEKELEALKVTMADTQPIGPILNVAKTLDQAKAVMAFVDAVSEKALNRTACLTAGRGRGKSAALGLAIASAVAYGYSNIFVTAPSPENLTTVFEFILKGFDALGMTEHHQYELVQADNPELNKALVRINVFRDHRQTVQYVNPSDWQHLAQAELLVIDEAAAIPLPIVKKLLGPYLVLISSTVNGYEGTGRALSLKLIEDLKQGKAVGRSGTERTLRELTLDEPIRYAKGDHVEKWLNTLLCLDAAQVPRLKLKTLPMPSQCGLFLVNRDALFSHHEASERFLFNMMSLFVSSHYKNTPNDMLMMADAPAHHVLVLLPPIDPTQEQTDLPEVLVAIQICMEGALTKDTVQAQLRRGHRPSGDLIPWTLSQQFLNDGFAELSGARIVRIATHPSLQRKGYASEAVKQLGAWFEQRSRDTSSFKKHSKKKSKEPKTTSTSLLEEELAPREAPPLLEPVSETAPPYDLDYLGTAFGLTIDLFGFWNKAGFKPVYLRQSSHDATGENSCILLRDLRPLEGESRATAVVEAFSEDFRGRYLRLLQGPFREQPTRLALSLVDPPVDSSGGSSQEVVVKETSENAEPLVASSLLQFLSRDDIHRLEQYGRNLVEYQLIFDIVPTLSLLVLSRRFPQVHLSHLQNAILVAVGCQHKSIDQVAKEFNVKGSQLLALFNKAMHKLANACRTLLEQQVEEEDGGLLQSGSAKVLKSGDLMSGGKIVKESLKKEQQATAKKANTNPNLIRENPLMEELMGKDEYRVLPDEEAFREALGGSKPSGGVSVKGKRSAGDGEPSGAEAKRHKK